MRRGVLPHPRFRLRREIFQIGGHALVVLAPVRRRDPLTGCLWRSIFLQGMVIEFGLFGRRSIPGKHLQLLADTVRSRRDEPLQCRPELRVHA
jgi:hypothetical protein